MSWFTRKDCITAADLQLTEGQILNTLKAELKPLKQVLAQLVAQVMDLKRTVRTGEDRLAKKEAEYTELLKQHLELAIKVAVPTAPAPASQLSMKQLSAAAYKEKVDKESFEERMRKTGLFDEVPLDSPEGYSRDELLFLEEALIKEQPTDAQEQEEAG